MKPALWIVALLLALSVDTRADILFRDNFDGGKSSRWKQRNDGDLPGGFRVQSGTYTLISNNSVASLPRSIIYLPELRDYFVQADVRIRPTNNAYSATSLLSYYTDSNNFYEFSLDAQHHYWMLQKVDKSGTALLARGPIPGKPRSLFRMGFYFRQGNLRALIDGILVADELDPAPLPAGGFGLASQGAESRWDNVIVKDSNPLDFFYSIESHAADASGKVKFNNVSLTAVDTSDKPVANAIIYRIRRDGLSYFVIHDPAGHSAVRSGFLSEFTSISENGYRITLPPAGAQQAQHVYDSYQVEWLLDFLRRAARISPRGVTADLRTSRKIYLRNGAFQSEEGPVTDSELASTGVATEVNQIDYGKWEEFGNYTKFPSVLGKTSAASDLIRRAAAVAPVPPGTRFSLYTLRLASNAAPVSLAWLVQEDPRAFLLVDAAGLPTSLQKGQGSSIPFTLLNTGENAGPFTISVILSRNGFPGATDLVLGKRSYSNLAAGGQIRSDIPIQVPATVADGVYFIATFLQIDQRHDRLLRVHNGNQLKPVTVGNQPPPGRLTATLTWSGAADLDLHVTDPLGETIYYFRPASDSGGRLLRDRECGGSQDAEVVEYPNGTAQAGNYAISVHYFRRCGGPEEVSWTVTVDSDKGSRSYSGKISGGQYVRAADYPR